MKKLSFVSICFLFLFAIENVNAQSITPDVIGSAGTFATSTSGSMSWTIGEVMTETYSSSGNFFTQGFQQPDTSFSIGIAQPVSPNFSVYPNPVIDHLVIDFSSASGNYKMEIFDMQGQLLSSSIVTANQTQLNVSFVGFDNGIYLLNITNTETNTKNSYRIIKAN